MCTARYGNAPWKGRSGETTAINSPFGNKRRRCRVSGGSFVKRATQRRLVLRYYHMHNLNAVFFNAIPRALNSEKLTPISVVSVSVRKPGSLDFVDGRGKFPTVTRQLYCTQQPGYSVWHVWVTGSRNCDKVYF